MSSPKITIFSGFVLFLTASLLQPVSPSAAPMTDQGGYPEGTVVSGNAQLAPSGNAIVYTVPADRILVLTTVCANTAVELSGSTLGLLGIEVNRDCLTISPVGFVVPKGEVISCENQSGGAGACSVSGILVDKRKKENFPFKF